MEFRGINEAYADIFGIIMGNNTTWQLSPNIYDGKEVVLRDIATYDAENSMTKSPRTYHGENWEDEEHTISVLI